MMILGVASLCDGTAASLVVDGKLVALVEQERMDRIKYTWVPPVDAARECLRIAGASPNDVDRIALFWNPFLELLGNARYFITGLPSTLQLLNSKTVAGDMTFFPKFVRNVRTAGDFAPLFNGRRLPLSFVPHHMAHAGSGFLASPYDDAAILVCDGRAEYTSVMLGIGEGTKVRKLGLVKLPHSLGLLYSSITAYLGFRPFSDEGKVMGLAAYGDDRYIKPFGKVVRYGGPDLALDLSYFAYHYRARDQWFTPKLEAEFGPARKPGEEITDSHRAVARALQHHLEEAGLSLARWLREKTGKRKLCVSGGLFLNCQMNRRILDEAGFDELFIMPIAGDTGSSYGAALWEHARLGGRRTEAFRNIYLGSSFSEAEMEAAIVARGLPVERAENAPRDAAKAIAAGKIVGWFQGRMEAGPRALGNRSILADPRDPNTRERLNRRIKKREEFRPFAPSVQWERANDYFDLPVESPYMILTAPVHEPMKSVIPAVVHVDGTGRVQTVRREDNEPYWQLIDAFREETGVALVLNTSFNENEPIVRTPEEALDCFLRTGMDLLYLGPYCVERM